MSEWYSTCEKAIILRSIFLVLLCDVFVSRRRSDGEVGVGGRGGPQGQGGGAASQRLVRKALPLGHEVLKLSKIHHSVFVFIKLFETGVDLHWGKSWK